MCFKSRDCKSRLDLPKLQDLSVWKYDDALNLGLNTSALPTSIALILKEIREDDRKLRDKAVEFVALHARKLLNRDDFTLLFKDRPDLLLEIVKLSIQQFPSGNEGCPWTESGCEDCVIGLKKISRTYSKAWKEAKAAGRNKWFCINCDRAFG